MGLTITTIKPLSTDGLREALALLANRCFPALNLANALSGYPTERWQAIREHGPVALIAEARERGIVLAEIKGSVDGQLLLASAVYRTVVGLAPELDLPAPVADAKGG